MWLRVHEVVCDLHLLLHSLLIVAAAGQGCW